jgi:ankyrin repeat protein
MKRLIILLLTIATTTTILSATQLINNCSICLENINPVERILECPKSREYKRTSPGADVHKFHNDCIQREWMEQNQCCPVCKQEWLLFQDRRLLIPVIARGDVALALQLIQNPNRNINERDEDGNTPLMIAALYGYHEAVVALLGRQDCDVNLYNDNGDTALLFAVDR